MYDCSDPVMGMPDLILELPSSACKEITYDTIVGERTCVNSEKAAKYIEGTASGYCGKLWYLNTQTQDCTDAGGSCGNEIEGRSCNSATG